MIVVFIVAIVVVLRYLLMSEIMLILLEIFLIK